MGFGLFGCSSEKCAEIEFDAETTYLVMKNIGSFFILEGLYESKGCNKASIESAER